LREYDGEVSVRIGLYRGMKGVKREIVWNGRGLEVEYIL
jgi:hypothetical protein